MSGRMNLDPREEKHWMQWDSGTPEPPGLQRRLHQPYPSNHKLKLPVIDLCRSTGGDNKIATHPAKSDMLQPDKEMRQAEMYGQRRPDVERPRFVNRGTGDMNPDELTIIKKKLPLCLNENQPTLKAKSECNKKKTPQLDHAVIKPVHRTISKRGTLGDTYTDNSANVLPGKYDLARICVKGHKPETIPPNPYREYMIRPEPSQRVGPDINCIPVKRERPIPQWQQVCYNKPYCLGSRYPWIQEEINYQPCYTEDWSGKTCPLPAIRKPSRTSSRIPVATSISQCSNHTDFLKNMKRVPPIIPQTPPPEPINETLDQKRKEMVGVVQRLDKNLEDFEGVLI